MPETPSFNPEEVESALKSEEQTEIRSMEAPNGNTYSYEVMQGPDEDGSTDTFIQFPDLPGCMTQISVDADIEQAASEILSLWVEGEMQLGNQIPEPQFNT